MQLLTIPSLVGLFLLFPLYAEEIQRKHAPELSSSNQEVPLPTIQELVTEVKNAPDNQKRVLINKLKIQLKSMNQENRKKVMMELKKSFSKESRQKKDKHQQHQKQQKHESCQQTNHQPKFRHLRKGPRDGSGSHRGEGHGKK